MTGTPDRRRPRCVACLRRRAGFTLVEVLVALAIVGVALSAAFRSVAQSTETAAAIRARTLALWVAQNRLADLQLGLARPDPGERSGRAIQGGSEFWWRERVIATPNPRVRRVDLDVGEPARPGYALAGLVGYVGAPPSP